MATKEQILERTKGGLHYFLLIYKLHGITLKVRGNRIDNTYNLLYYDTTPSFSIYYNEKYSRWFFKDHGTNEEGIEYSGDVFEFARLYYKLEQERFKEVLYRMDIDLTINEHTPLLGKLHHYSYTQITTKKSDKYELLKIPPTDECVAYYKQFDIDLTHYFNVHQIVGIRFLNEENKITYTKMLPQNNIHVAYDFKTYAKIYSIHPKGFRFVGKKNVQYTFGGFDYAEYLHKPLFLTGGEKDVMTLHALGFEALCLLSETTTHLSRGLVKGMYESGHRTIVLYDTDTTGKQSAKKLHEKYDYEVADLSQIIPESHKEKITDVSDYVKEGLCKERLKAFLESFIPSKKIKMVNGRLLEEELES